MSRKKCFLFYKVKVLFLVMKKARQLAEKEEVSKTKGKEK